MFHPYGVRVERLFSGEPIIRPDANSWWENGVTFNSAAVYLNRSEKNDEIIKKLAGVDSLDDDKLKDGVVALNYRASPMEEVGYRWARSYVGMAVYTPEYELLRRYKEPVILPGSEKHDCDYLGIEDPRVTPMNGYYYMVYKGSSDNPQPVGRNCFARSIDLLNWEKFGPFKGEVDDFENKNGVLFPEKIEGHYFLLHRPWGDEIGGLSDFNLHIAMSESLEGNWKNLGTVIKPYDIPCTSDSWNGSGSVPIPLGCKKYLVIYHTGNFHKTGEKEYDLCAAIFDFNKFDPENPQAMVTKRIEPLMVPQTDYETKPGLVDDVTNTLYTCGTYVYKGDLYIVYGGSDTYIMVAKVAMDELLEALYNSNNENPYLKYAS